MRTYYILHIFSFFIFISFFFFFPERESREGGAEGEGESKLGVEPVMGHNLRTLRS